jgi:hypothetical protein
MAEEQPRYQEWQCPPAGATEDRIIGWLNEATEEGQAWLKNQRGCKDFRKAFDLIAGEDTSTPPATYRSKVYPNRLKRNTREVVGALAKLRPMWGYHSDNTAYKEQAAMMNKVTKALYLENFFDISIMNALKFAAATARGWIRPVYRRDMYGTGKGHIRLLSYGSPCVLPLQLPSDGDWQNAYTVTILDEMPVAMAHGMWPTFQDRIRPTTSRYWYSDDVVRKAAQGNWVSRVMGKVRRTVGDTAISDLLVPIRYTYILDLTMNRTDKPIPMGEPGSSWAYNVPYLGQIISEDGNRKADEVKSRLYPYRRLIISTDTVKLYDGPAFDWHGMLPLASFTVDDWPWEPLGFSIIRDGWEINESIRDIYRGNMDKVSAQLNPSLVFDTNATSMAEARKFDPYRPADRIGFDGNAVESANVFGLAVPMEVMKIEESSLALADKLEAALDAQMAINDVAALAKMRSVGSMDELEKVIEAQGPIIESMSRTMEPPMRDIGVMVKYLVLQYMNTARVMQYIGADNVSSEIFDYDPSSIIPSHMHGEDPSRGDSAYTKIQRARIFADNLRFFIMPNSLHEMSQMVMKLGLIQLRKAGIKISSQTIAEAWSVPNYGDFEGTTEIEKWRSEQEEDLEFMARMQAIGAALGGNLPPGAAGPGKPNPEGRPPSGNAPPALKQKEGGARSTITESK